MIIIDEIHLLGESRGPVLEEIICRSKILSQKSSVNIWLVGLSATLPNY